MVEALSRRRLLLAVGAVGAGVAAGEFIKTGGDADAMVPAGGGGGTGDVDGDFSIRFFEAASADDLESGSAGDVAVVTGTDVPTLYHGYQTMQEIDPGTYQADSSDFDASTLDQYPALVVVPDDGRAGSTMWVTQ